MNALLLSWAFLASGVGLLFGLFMCFVPGGHTPAGISVTLASGLLGYAALKLARELWGRRRYYYIEEESAAAPSATRFPSAAAVQKAARPRRAVGTTPPSRDAA